MNSTSKSGHTALMRAAIRDHTEVTSLLRSAGASVGLVEAAMLGETAMVRSFLEGGGEIETRSDAKMTPLMAAAACGHLDTVKCLLDLGADRYASTRFGHTPLAWAVMYNRFEVVNLFLDLGLNINTPFVSDNAHLNNITVLHMAVGRCNESMLRLLFARGANVHLTTTSAQTALHYAVMYRKIRAVEVLLEAGADIDAKDSRSRTPLMIGVEMHHGRYGEEMVRILLDHGADVNATQDHGWSALTQAARYGSKPMVEMLLDAGADMNAVDTHGCSILASAAQEGNAEIAALLKARGAKVDASPFGDLFGAALFGHQDVLEALRDQEDR